MKEKVILVCSECLSRNYSIPKNKRVNVERLESKKELAYNSMIVLVFCFLFGVYFYGSDAIIALILKALGMN